MKNEEVSVDNVYRHRWIWYHTILALLLFLANIQLLALIVVISIKL